MDSKIILLRISQCVTVDGVWIGEWIYWPLTHMNRTTTNYRTGANLHSLQITTCQVFSAFCVSSSRSLATTSNSRDSSASRAHVVTVRRISRNWTHSAGLGPSLYNLGVTLTENTSSSPSIVNGRLPSDSSDIVSARTYLPSRCSETAVCWNHLFIPYYSSNVGIKIL
jgi:hypothetical protein